MRRRLVITTGILGALLAGAAVYLFAPFGEPDLRTRPHPAADYAAALTRIDAVRRAEETMPLAPYGRSFALLHGSRTETAVVILHGFTAAPGPFKSMAQAYYSLGYNVWVPRAPYHGYADKLTTDISRLTPQELRAYADAAVDVGAGLGDRIIVVGQSGGGVLAEWALTQRREVVAAAALTPFFHPKDGLPVWMMRPLARYLGIGPDFWKWWDEDLKGSPAGIARSPNAYPRGSVRAMSAYLTVGRWLSDGRGGTAAPGKRLVLVANEADPSIDWPYNVAVARSLVPGDGLTVYRIPAAERLEHDLVDAQDRNKDRIAVSYAHLGKALGIDLLGQLPGP